MTPQSVGAVDDERRLVEEFYYRSIPVNTGLILAPLLSPCREMRLMLVLVGRVKEKLLEDGLLESTFVTKRG